VSSAIEAALSYVDDRGVVFEKVFC